MLLRNYWYVAAWSDELSNKPLARMILNEPVALFRAPDGKACALQDRCAENRREKRNERHADEHRSECDANGVGGADHQRRRRIRLIRAERQRRFPGDDPFEPGHPPPAAFRRLSRAVFTLGSSCNAIPQNCRRAPATSAGRTGPIPHCQVQARRGV